MAKLTAKYTYRVEWSEEDAAHIAFCLEFPSLAAHGDTPEKALSEIKKVVGAAIRWMEEEGEHVPEPFGTRKYRGLPFEACLYNDETIQAMIDAREGRNLVGPFDTVEEMMASLLSDDDDELADGEELPVREAEESVETKVN